MSPWLTNGCMLHWKQTVLLRYTGCWSRKLFLLRRGLADCVKCPKIYDLWYDDKPLKNSSFVQTLQNICHGNKCSKTYIVHGLKQPAMSIMNHAIIETHLNLLNQKKTCFPDIDEIIEIQQNLFHQNPTSSHNLGAIIVTHLNLLNKKNN